MARDDTDTGIYLLRGTTEILPIGQHQEITSYYSSNKLRTSIIDHRLCYSAEKL